LEQFCEEITVNWSKVGQVGADRAKLKEVEACVGLTCYNNAL